MIIASFGKNHVVFHHIKCRAFSEWDGARILAILETFILNLMNTSDVENLQNLCGQNFLGEANNKKLDIEDNQPSNLNSSYLSLLLVLNIRPCFFYLLLWCI